MPTRKIFRISFLSQGQVYEIYADGVIQSDILGFVEVEGVRFGERSQVVLDPSEERLKTEFDGVRRFHVPMHAVLRIDEVEKEGASRILEGSKEGGSVTPFPLPVFPPKGGSSES